MELKPGYKQTEVGVIPEDWDCVSIRSAASNAPNAIVGGPFGSDLTSADYVYSGVPVIRGTNMGPKMINGPFVFVSTSKAAALSANLARPRDIVFTQRGTLGQVSLVPEKPFESYLVSQSQMKISIDCNRYSHEYIYHYFFSAPGQKQILDSAIQTGVPHTNLGICKKYIFPAPVLAEQETISEIFNDIDFYIEAIRKLVDKKKEIKQAAMQELLTGKRRLPGFEGEWEVKRLREIGKCYRGVSYKGDADLMPHDTANTIRLLRSNNVQDSFVKISELKHVYNKRVATHQILTRDDIVICMANGSKSLVGKAGRFQVNDGYRYTFGAFMGCFRTNPEKADPGFTFYLLQTERYQRLIGDLLAGSSINNLKPSSIESLEFLFPERAEQLAIATVLSDIDAELTSLQNRRDSIQEVKQGMMQQLLTGKIRLR